MATLPTQLHIEVNILFVTQFISTLLLLVCQFLNKLKADFIYNRKIKYLHLTVLDFAKLMFDSLRDVNTTNYKHLLIFLN